MADVSAIGLKNTLQADVPTPSTNKYFLFFDDASGQLAYKDDTGTVFLIGGGSGSPALTILTSDPASPVNNTGWLLYNAGTGALSLRARLAGVTYNVDLATIP